MQTAETVALPHTAHTDTPYRTPLHQSRSSAFSQQSWHRIRFTCAQNSGGFVVVELVAVGSFFDNQQVSLHDVPLLLLCCVRSEEHTSELQSLMRISYAVF